ncbi:MAG: NAD(P)-dependent oxidoreductase, partial [Verrucomicrobiae bacterium]|nr:NAD(P)-dependent oxidoreductase [Verrucomicrobiae bacterium]
MSYLDRLFSLEGRTAVVIGGTGVLCGEMAQGLAEAGAEVALVGRSEEKAAERLAKIEAAGGRGYFVGTDVASRASLEALLATVMERSGKVDVLVNGAGVNSPTPVLEIGDEEFARILDINLGGLMGLLEAARIHRLGRIVWFSSIMAYGERGDREPVGEEVALHPHTVYGATKAAGEALVDAYGTEQGVDAVALRVASCYGPGRTTACLIRTLVEDGLAGRATRVHPADGRSRQHIFVEDVVDAVLATLDAPALPRRAYNIGPGRSQTLDEIVAAVREA